VCDSEGVFTNDSQQSSSSALSAPIYTKNHVVGYLKVGSAQIEDGLVLSVPGLA
jgi:hypothetical protein